MTLDGITLPDVGTATATADHWRSANEPLSAIVTAGLSMPDALGRWGLQLLKAGAMTDAVTVLRVACALAQDDAGAWMNLGLALDRTASVETAATCLERSLELSAWQPHTWLLLGMVRRKQSDLAGAEAAYRRSIEQEPTSAAAWQCLGLLKESQRDYGAAIECFLACVKSGGGAAETLANLGRLYYQMGRLVEARDAFTSATTLDPANAHYLEMLRKTRFLCAVVQDHPVDEALADYEASFGSQPGPTPEERLLWLENAGGMLTGFEYLRAAVRVSEKRLELQPSSPSAKYLLDALRGKPGVDRSPPQYVVESFDAFADGFDEKVIGVLDYDIPEKLTSIVTQATAAGHLYDALDMGCGTGLCGPLLRPMSRRLVGVDLSPKMLKRAATRGVYDDLVREDLPPYLDRCRLAFDLIVAADLFIYFGDLFSLLAHCAETLRPGGLLAFNTERLDQEGYRILPAGRFAHAPTYVRAACGSAFEEDICIDTTIRLEAGQRVAGNLFLLRRRT